MDIGREFGSGNNTIFLPAVGVIDGDGSFREGAGYYFGSTSFLSNSYAFAFNSGTVYSSGDAGGGVQNGMSVRCVKDESNTGVNSISSDTATVTGYFDVLGRRLKEEPTKGLYIIQYDNGKTKKMMK